MGKNIEKIDSKSMKYNQIYSIFNSNPFKI